MHSSCKRDQTGAAPVVGSISSPVAQPVERPTLNREVDGANPSGAAISSLRHAAPCAGRSIRRSPHRHCGGRRGRTAPAHHFHNAPVAQCIERRASNAEVAGEIPAGSTTHFSRRSPTSRGTPLRTEPVRVQLLPPGPFCSRSPTAEAPNSNLGQCECNSRRGHQWNVNRTSEPGLFAKEIVAHSA